MFSDCHAHFSGLTAGEVKEIVQRAEQEGIEVIVVVGENLETSMEAVNIAETYDIVYAAVGIHPWKAVPIDEDLYQKLKALASRNKVAAICEVGLDFAGNMLHPEKGPPDDNTREVQKQAFARQLRLARELNKPANVHLRGAFRETIDILKKEEGVKAVLHGFMGDEDMLQEAVKLGCYFSEGRTILTPEMITDPGKFQAMVKKIPADRLLMETDMAPAYPQFGVFMPWDVKRVAEQVAQIRGTTTEEVGRLTTANLKHLLGI